ncbi:SsgA family sporulation/cell division regulator [Streptomyces sp. AA1529]|uniref:SsgA family sporulation/cell division regulator n=1 Tax=Streptomyces sp. AA1529 TaxID=1203257 RepID=UPI00030DE875|nr:SsgA family sporulation/cell division regulator [Streptomyces sp. AA1529]
MADTGNRPNHSEVFGEDASSGPCVTGEWQVSLVLSDEWAAPLPAQFTYSAEDPYAVRLDFYLTMANPISWVFARELLIAGALRSSGQGDVRAWPTYDDMICLCLNSRDGEALLEMPVAPLIDWLERTYQLVPPGREHAHQPLDADTLLRRLLDEQSPDAAAPEGREATGRPYEGPAGTARRHTYTMNWSADDGHGDPR